MTNRTKAVAQGEKKLTAALVPILAEFGRQIAETTTKKVFGKADTPDEAAAAAQDVDLDWSLMIAPTATQLTFVATAGVRRALMTLGVTDEGITDQASETAVAWANNRAAELVGMKYDASGKLVPNPRAEMTISDEIRDSVRAKVEEAVQNGYSAARLSKEIQGLEEFSAERATMIARTEIVRANCQGNLTAFKASGVVQKKAWSTAEDGDTCDDCTENEAAGPIDLDDDFPSGDDAPAAHPNCRCALVAVVENPEEEE